MKNAFIFGINGKMGTYLCQTAPEYDYSISGGFDVQADARLNIFNDVKDINVPIDVIIDFSRPADNIITAIETLCAARRIPVVIATTGFDNSGIARISALSKKTAVFKSANMSLGIAALKAAAITVQKILGDFDIEIVEKHHNQKADSPSGTALALAEALTDKDKIVTNRNGKRNAGELGISSVRGGGVVGEHEIGFYGEDEIVALSHSARSRKLFAAGAFKAADFVLSAPEGLYDMDDLVKTLVN